MMIFIIITVIGMINTASECPKELNLLFKLILFYFQNKFYLFIYLFIYFGYVESSLLRAGFLQLQRAGATLHCSVQASHCSGFSLLWSTGSRHAGFSSCGTQAQQLWLAVSRAQAQQLWRMGLVALQHVRSSWTRARTRVPCIGRQILNHWRHQGSP